AEDGAFAEGCIADTILAKTVQESFGDLEGAAIAGDVLPHEDEVVVLLHGLGEAFADGVDESFFGAVVRPFLVGGHTIAGGGSIDIGKLLFRVDDKHSSDI